MKDKLIVALDVGNLKAAESLVETLYPSVKLFKVGSQLFTKEGPKAVEAIRRKGAKVFLDLKFHDIPNTITQASKSAAALGVFMFNVHALGGYDMMKAAVDAVKSAPRALKEARPKVLAVTILTSMDEKNLKNIGITDNVESAVLKLAKLAKEAGLDGVVASAAEVAMIKREFGKDFLIVTPGVRPLWAAKDDQKRVATPREAIENGADYIVVGRPIIEADDPLKAAEKILEEIGG